MASEKLLCVTYTMFVAGPIYWVLQIVLAAKLCVVVFLYYLHSFFIIWEEIVWASMKVWLCIVTKPFYMQSTIHDVPI